MSAVLMWKVESPNGSPIFRTPDLAGSPVFRTPDLELAREIYLLAPAGSHLSPDMPEPSTAWSIRSLLVQAASLIAKWCGRHLSPDKPEPLLPGGEQ